MCGFAGFIDFSKKSSKVNLVAMCDVMQHRGPESGVYYFEYEEGFQIGNKTVVGAHSLVNKSYNENSIYAGIPAKEIKSAN